MLNKTNFKNSYFHQYPLGYQLNTIQIETYYQDDDEYWDGTKNITQYDTSFLEPPKEQYNSIVSILQKQLKDKDNEIKKLNESIAEKIEDVKVNYNIKFKSEYEKLKESYDKTIQNLQKRQTEILDNAIDKLSSNSSTDDIIETNNEVNEALQNQILELQTENQTLTEINKKINQSFSKSKNDNIRKQIYDFEAGKEEQRNKIKVK